MKYVKVVAALSLALAWGCSQQPDLSALQAAGQLETPPWTEESVLADIEALSSSMPMIVSQQVGVLIYSNSRSGTKMLPTFQVTLPASTTGMAWLPVARTGWRLNFLDHEENVIEMKEEFQMSMQVLNFPFANHLPSAVQSRLLDWKKSSIPTFDVKSPASSLNSLTKGALATLDDVSAVTFDCNVESKETPPARVLGRLGFQVPLQYANIVFPLDGTATAVKAGEVEIKVEVVDMQNFVVIYQNLTREYSLEHPPVVQGMDLTGTLGEVYASNGSTWITDTVGNATERVEFSAPVLPAKIRVRLPISFIEKEVEIDLKAFDDAGPPVHARPQPPLEGISREQALRDCRVEVERVAGHTQLTVKLPEVAGAEYSTMDLSGIALGQGEQTADTSYPCLSNDPYVRLDMKRAFHFEILLDHVDYNVAGFANGRIPTEATRNFTSAKGMVKVSLPSRYEVQFVAAPGGNVPNFRFEIAEDAVKTITDRSIPALFPCIELPPRITALDSNDKPLLRTNPHSLIDFDAPSTYAGKVAKVKVEYVAEMIDLLFPIDIRAEDLGEPITLTAQE